MKRTKAELKEIRDRLQPGTVFTTRQGSIVKVLTRTTTEDGVLLGCKAIAENGYLTHSESMLTSTAGRLVEFKTEADFLKAMDTCRVGKGAKSPDLAAALELIRELEGRIARLEIAARVAGVAA